MNISRDEQRVLHALAQGGHIRHLRGTGNKVADITCFTHDGMVLKCGTLPLRTPLTPPGEGFSASDLRRSSGALQIKPVSL